MDPTNLPQSDLWSAVAKNHWCITCHFKIHNLKYVKSFDTHLSSKQNLVEIVKKGLYEKNDFFLSGSICPWNHQRFIITVFAGV